MAMYQTFSKRQRPRNGDQRDYRYNELPESLRVQVIHIWIDAIGKSRYLDIYGLDLAAGNDEAWDLIHKAMCRELGVFTLSDSNLDPFAKCSHFLMTASADRALDLIDLSFKWIDNVARYLKDHERQRLGITQKADSAIHELNARLMEHGLGYLFIDGQILRLDSKKSRDFA